MFGYMLVMYTMTINGAIDNLVVDDSIYLYKKHCEKVAERLTEHNENIKTVCIEKEE